MGLEGANVMFDTWIHPLMMGLEEHLIGMFREDFEFHAGAAPSHLGGHGPATTRSDPPTSNPAAPELAQRQEAQVPAPAAAKPVSAILSPGSLPPWSPEAERELGKIPFFVRGKARRNTERYAGERGVATITVETLYDAKAHYSR
jgi:light-independent protochlorophyllide reductase subunit B